MREELAEQLLGDVLEWDTSTAKDEINKLRYLSAVKYDSYHNFEPGKRFLESLVTWLHQFKTLDERQVAYKFIIERLLFVSEKQIDHLVDLLYPQRIFPILLEQAKKIDNKPAYKVKEIRESETFKTIARKTLFLGMSDGARMDAFRRKHLINNEQVCVSYELSDEKWERMQEELVKWMNGKELVGLSSFDNIFLIDDFSGSGNSILNVKGGKYKGKLARFVNESLGNQAKPGSLGKLYKTGGPKIYVITYISTETAIEQLKKNVGNFIRSIKQPRLTSCEILEPLQAIAGVKSPSGSNNNINNELDQLLNTYYDNRIEDEHTKTGGGDVKYGYAGCGLLLTLYHNCPNNSIYLLWGQTEKTDQHTGLEAIFPRISRHSEER